MVDAQRGPLRAVLACVAALVASTCARAPQVSPLDRLHACATDEGPADAYCGTLRVYENRQARSGRRINLTVVLLPAVIADSRPDPSLFLAGGPGQGAAKMAPLVRQ